MTSSKCEKIFQISIEYSETRTRCIKSDLVRHVFTFVSSGCLGRSTSCFVSIDSEKSSLSSSIESAIRSEAILRKIFDFAREGLNNTKKYRAAETVLCAVRVVERKGKREGRERERERKKATTNHIRYHRHHHHQRSHSFYRHCSPGRAHEHTTHTRHNVLSLSTPYLYIYLSLHSFLKINQQDD